MQVCTQEEEAAAREELIQIFLEQDMPEEDIKLNLQVPI